MIKKILKISILSLFLFSCDDAIEITQDGELNDAALFTNTSNMRLFLNETYDRFNMENNLMLTSILTDEVGIGSAGGTSQTYKFQIFTDNTFALNIWNINYQAINYANRLIRGAQSVTPVDANDQLVYNDIIAQAKVLRSLAHFQLMTYFSEDLTDDNGLGVMKVDFVPTAQQKISRATNGEVFQLIEDDLAYATTNLKSTNTYKYANKNMVNAFRARMYLYRGNYTLAEQYADEVITNSGIALASCLFTLPANFPTTSDAIVPTGANTGSSSFDAAPTGANSAIQLALYTMDRWAPTSSANSPMYRKMWVDNQQGESIFSISKLNNATNFSSRYNTNQSYTGGAPLYDVGRTLYNLYTQPLGGGAQDFRRWAFVDRSSLILADPTTASKSNEVIVIDKYPGKAGSHNSNDIKVFRISEMYLIKAECRARANDYIGAAGALQTLRQSRNYINGAIVPLPVYVTLQNALQDILLERRKELCFEGHRYIDLKRLGTEAGILTTDRYFQDSFLGQADTPYNIDTNDYRLTLPIPQNEINVNPMTQNTGYN
ncbi:MAG: RagB/SusD family nutrient uptake outer membrane protein [Bacteroidota bacterium]